MRRPLLRASALFALACISVFLLVDVQMMVTTTMTTTTTMKMAGEKLSVAAGAGPTQLLHATTYQVPTQGITRIAFTNASYEDRSPGLQRGRVRLSRDRDGTRSARQAQGRSQPSDFLRILLFITTHASSSHANFFQYCWPIAVNISTLLRSADVLIYTASDGENATQVQSIVPDIFPPPQSITFQYYNNTAGYQGGAMGAMQDAIRGNWFGEYDWIVRLNPDVIVRNDTSLLGFVHNSSVDAILAECPRTLRSGSHPIHTDFFAFRPNATGVDWRQFQRGRATAELQAMFAFRPVIRSGRQVWLPDVQHPDEASCRLVGSDVPVAHDHGLVDRCRVNGTLWDSIDDVR